MTIDVFTISLTLIFMILLIVLCCIKKKRKKIDVSKNQNMMTAL